MAVDEIKVTSLIAKKNVLSFVPFKNDWNAEYTSNAIERTRSELEFQVKYFSFLLHKTIESRAGALV